MKIRIRPSGGYEVVSHTGAKEGGMDKTHGLIEAGMPGLYSLNGEFGGSDDVMRKILPEIVRPIRERAKGPRDR